MNVNTSEGNRNIHSCQEDFYLFCEQGEYRMVKKILKSNKYIDPFLDEQGA